MSTHPAACRTKNSSVRTLLAFHSAYFVIEAETLFQRIGGRCQFLVLCNFLRTAPNISFRNFDFQLILNVLFGQRIAMSLTADH
jgi:hypothetical protein